MRCNLGIGSSSKKRKYEVHEVNCRVRITWRPRAMRPSQRCTTSVPRGEKLFKNNNDHKHKSNDKSGNVMPRSCLQSESNFHGDARRPCSLQRSEKYSNLLERSSSASGALSMDSRRDRHSRPVSNLLFCPSLLFIDCCLPTVSWFTCGIITINVHQSDAHIQHF